MLKPCICNSNTALGSVGTELAGYSKKIFVYIQGNNLRIFSEEPSGSEGDIPIIYCPMCGAKLKKRSYHLYNPTEVAEKSKCMTT